MKDTNKKPLEIGKCYKNIGQYVKQTLNIKDDTYLGELNEIIGEYGSSDPRFAGRNKIYIFENNNKLDEYLIKNGKEYGWEKVRNTICKSRGQNVCSILDKVGLAFSIKAHGNEAIHHTKDTVKNLKIGDIGKASLKGKKAYAAGEETYGLASGEEGGEA